MTPDLTTATKKVVTEELCPAGKTVQTEYFDRDGKLLRSDLTVYAVPLTAEGEVGAVG